MNKMSKKQIETKVETKKEEKDFSQLNKNARIVLFLKEIKENQIKNKEEIKRLYLEKYNLSEKSQDINLRIFERFFGEYSKYSEEKKIERKNFIKENLSKSSIDYEFLLESFKELKEKVKRSNRINNFMEIENL